MSAVESKLNDYLIDFRNYLTGQKVPFVESHVKNAALDEVFIAFRNTANSLKEVDPVRFGKVIELVRSTFAKFEPGYKPTFYVVGAYAELKDPWSYAVETAEEYIAVGMSAFLETDEVTVDKSDPGFGENLAAFIVLLVNAGIKPEQVSRVWGRVLFN